MKYEGTIRNGKPEGIGYCWYDSSESDLLLTLDSDMVQANFCRGKPSGIARFYIRHEDESLDHDFKSEDDTLLYGDQYYKLKFKAIVNEDMEPVLFLVAFFNGRTVFLNSKNKPAEIDRDQDENDTPENPPYFAMMFDFNSRYLDYVGYLKNEDDTFDYGMTGSSDNLMQSKNLETCYEGIAYHYSKVAEQYAVVDWPIGNDTDKLARGTILMKNWKIVLCGVWDNEDTRLVKITEITFPDGSHFVADG